MFNSGPTYPHGPPSGLRSWWTNSRNSAPSSAKISRDGQGNLRAELNQIKQNINADSGQPYSFEDESKFTQATIDVTSLRELPVQMAQVMERIDQLDGIRKNLDNPSIGTVERLSIIASADAESPVQNRSDGRKSDARRRGVRLNHRRRAKPGRGKLPIPLSCQASWRRRLSGKNLEKSQRELQKQRADLSRIFLPGNAKMAAVEKQLQQVAAESGCRLRPWHASVLTFVYHGLQDHYADLQKKLPSTITPIANTPKFSRTPCSTRTASWAGRIVQRCR